MSLVRAVAVEAPVRAVILGVTGTKAGRKKKYPALSFFLPSRLLQVLPMGQTQLDARGQGSPGEVVCRDSPPLAQNRCGWGWVIENNQNILYIYLGVTLKTEMKKIEDNSTTAGHFLEDGNNCR